MLGSVSERSGCGKCASVWHGQKTDQFDKDDAELPDLGGRRIHAPIVRAAGALCVEDLLAGLVLTELGCPGIAESLP